MPYPIEWDDTTNRLLLHAAYQSMRGYDCHIDYAVIRRQIPASHRPSISEIQAQLSFLRDQKVPWGPTLFQPPPPPPTPPPGTTPPPPPPPASPLLQANRSLPFPFSPPGFGNGVPFDLPVGRGRMTVDGRPLSAVSAVSAARESTPASAPAPAPVVGPGVARDEGMRRGEKRMKRE
ncbi:hypothetical protein FKW77_005013 [Venturia effusa]|uniref:Uncharacterized protein n=1 Tax=Venturia effusa TaxID=50376 RepID=A0A517LH46_9PEZI|nr:hypothetical protein FKW77_005013 [Venturia effusa]